MKNKTCLKSVESLDLNLMRKVLKRAENSRIIFIGNKNK